MHASGRKGARDRAESYLEVFIVCVRLFLIFLFVHNDVLVIGGDLVKMTMALVSAPTGLRCGVNVRQRHVSSFLFPNFSLFF